MNKAIPNSAQTQWIEMTQAKKRKLPRPKPQDEINRLIDWYEKNKPDMPHVMPGGIAMSTEDLDRFATKAPNGGVWMYRGWRLEQADALPRKEKRMKIRR